MVPKVRSLNTNGEADPAIGDALTRSGFFVLQDHGLPRSLWDHAAQAAARAFALPIETKARYRGPSDGSQRGYLEMRTRLSDGRAALDRKECWHARRPSHRFANIFPGEVPELEPALLALIEAFDQLADWILRGIDAFLGNSALAQASQSGDSLFRINHYPPRHGDAQSAPRFGAHRDFDLITFLVGATVPGLEVQDKNGSWHPLTPSADAIVVNAGDLLEVASGGRIPSSLHRVVNPSTCDGGRLSMVYFVAPRPEIELAPGRLAGEIIDHRLRLAGYLQ
jgi:isopenicillin N synthase-like dioxygenase